MSTALVTGGSAGLGHALVTTLVGAGWAVVTDGRGTDSLQQLAAGLATGPGTLVTVAGDVTDSSHREALVASVRGTGRLDLLVNNASSLGATPMPRVAELSDEVLDGAWLTNVAAPHALTRTLVGDLLTSDGVLLNVSSDAAVEHYEGWGAYAATKAALDHLTLTLAAEHPDLHAYAVDPGDMRTAMHQAAFPGEDISDRPDPASVLPHLLGLLATRPASGRYRAVDLPAVEALPVPAGAEVAR